MTYEYTVTFTGSYLLVTYIISVFYLHPRFVNSFTLLTPTSSYHFNVWLIWWSEFGVRYFSLVKSSYIDRSVCSIYKDSLLCLVFIFYRGPRLQHSKDMRSLVVSVDLKFSRTYSPWFSRDVLSHWSWVEWRPWENKWDQDENSSKTYFCSFGGCNQPRIPNVLWDDNPFFSRSHSRRCTDLYLVWVEDRLVVFLIFFLFVVLVVKPSFKWNTLFFNLPKTFYEIY